MRCLRPGYQRHRREFIVSYGLGTPTPSRSRLSCAFAKGLVKSYNLGIPTPSRSRLSCVILIYDDISVSAALRREVYRATVTKFGSSELVFAQGKPFQARSRILWNIRTHTIRILQLQLISQCRPSRAPNIFRH